MDAHRHVERAGFEQLQIVFVVCVGPLALHREYAYRTRSETKRNEDGARGVFDGCAGNLQRNALRGKIAVSTHKQRLAGVHDAKRLRFGTNRYVRLARRHTVIECELDMRAASGVERDKHAGGIDELREQHAEVLEQVGQRSSDRKQLGGLPHEFAIAPAGRPFHNSGYSERTPVELQSFGL